MIYLALGVAWGDWMELKHLLMLGRAWEQYFRGRACGRATGPLCRDLDHLWPRQRNSCHREKAVELLLISRPMETVKAQAGRDGRAFFDLFREPETVASTCTLRRAASLCMISPTPSQQGRQPFVYFFCINKFGLQRCTILKVKSLCPLARAFFDFIAKPSPLATAQINKTESEHGDIT